MYSSPGTGKLFVVISFIFFYFAVTKVTTTKMESLVCGEKRQQQQMQTTKATVNRKCLIKGNRENQYISADTHTQTRRHTHTHTHRQFAPVRSCRQNFRIRIRHVVQRQKRKSEREGPMPEARERGRMAKGRRGHDCCAVNAVR